MALKLQDIIADDVKALIRNLTDFENGQENFKACERFVMSNLLHHNHISVNKHAVRRSMDGMVTKFIVHGLSDQGQALETYVREFVATAAFRDHSTPDLEWCVLSLLLLLGQNPTNIPRSQKEGLESSDFTETEGDFGFDWTTFLREGDEKFQQDWHDSSSDEDETDRMGPMKNESEHSHPPTGLKETLSQSYSSLPSQDCTVPSISQECSFPPKPRALLAQNILQAECWLKNNIQHDWWTKAYVDQKPCSTHPYSKTAYLWGSDSKKNIKTSTLSEHRIVLETIWLLSAPCDSAVFMKVISDDGLEANFCVRPHLTIPSLIQDVFSCFMNAVCVAADKIEELQSFCKNIHKNSEEKKVCGTVEAYGCALQYELKSIQEVLSQLEQRAHKQDETLTLLIIEEELTPCLAIVDSLHKLHKSAILDQKNYPNWLCAVHLLCVILTGLRNEPGNVGINLRIFVKTFQVYIQIIDQWLSGGLLYDARDEFFIFRAEKRSSALGASFESRKWEKEIATLGVECPKALQVLERCLLKAAQPLHVLCELKRLPELRRHSSSRCTLERLFLSKLIYDLEACGVRNDQPKTEENQQNADIWWKSLDSHLPSEDTPLAKTRIPEKLSLLDSCIDVKAVMSHLHRLEEPLLVKDFRALFQTSVADSQHQSIGKELLNRLLPLSHSMVAHFPVESCIERAVLCLSADREGIAGALVADILVREHQLLYHIHSAQSVFLLQAVHKLQPFLSYIFNQILHRGDQMWMKSHTLSVLLQDCMDSDQFSSTISMGDKDPSEMNVLDWIDSIHIQYQLDWPLCAIFGDKSQHTYNHILHLLLKMRWGLWILEKLEVAGFNYQDDLGVSQRLFHLRYWLLHVVRGTYNFLAGHILSTLWIKFDDDIKRAKDMHSIIQVHDRFLDSALHQSLNASQPEPIKSALFQLVVLAENLHALWNCGLPNVSVSKLSNIEACYVHCHRFLAASLHTLEEEVRFQHLAVLSDLFNWNTPQEYP